jgi:hypothetical protein
MAVLLEPKLDFMRDTTAREKHSQIVSDPLVHRTLAVSLAEMHVRGLSPDAMAGVNSFVWTWLNLSEENPVPRSIPNKHLQSFGQPTTTSKPVISEI